MIGKTIESVKKYGGKGVDDENLIVMTFTDGTSIEIWASYGGYTGQSEDEYPSFIGIETEDKEDLANYNEVAL